MRLSNDSDVLVWSLSKYGKYSPKEGYALLLLDRNMMKYSWWWKVLWKFKFQLKEKLFSWFLLFDKALTRDIIVRKGREGPGRCYLCKVDVDSNLHIVVACPFSQCVWRYLEEKLKIYNLWSGSK